MMNISWWSLPSTDASINIYVYWLIWWDDYRKRAYAHTEKENVSWKNLEVVLIYTQNPHKLKVGKKCVCVESLHTPCGSIINRFENVIEVNRIFFPQMVAWSTEFQGTTQIFARTPQSTILKINIFVVSLQKQFVFWSGHSIGKHLQLKFKKKFQTMNLCPLTINS